MIAREYDEEQTYYLYDRGQRVVEVIENSGEMLDVTERNLWNPNAVDQVLATERINFDDPTPTVQTIWGITDKSGTVRDTIQPDYSAADKIVAIRYDEFGKPKEYDGYEDRFTPLYAGRDYDTVTGLYINRARWYDPESQRFISEDSWGYAAGIPVQRLFKTQSRT